MAGDIWNAQQYLRFENDRLRPFLDLVTQLDPDGEVRTVVDLGCGPGNATALLVDWWPDARIVGVDASPAMIEAAQRQAVPGRVEFELGDLRDWHPDTKVDVLLANAVLQWVPDHLDLLPGLAAQLAPGGVFGFQVPGNFEAPSHLALAEMKRKWGDRVPAGLQKPASHDPAVYLGKLAEAGLEPDVWETTYTYLVPADPDPAVPCGVTEFVRGSALRPAIKVLNESDAADFVAEYDALVRAAYPVREIGGRTVQLLPYRRIFAIGRSA
jgi:trans-aconitate 2-methyltransferase